ncbi:MAG: NAD-dependent protein deacetylase [Hydrocarboniphaga sp.]|uniref:NAD-dependent protein deacetylase n=1 Tax=Hydrocarboniphaga sp. TaxID=2033016 RepID=UPI0026379212|nr:NAD-dependent protein deacetylase [Hydrocarboniphaga sp.]MDB5968553.1 NAD-dependent protein deacetylase [Hydrocarboniphaga sp.]
MTEAHPTPSRGHTATARDEADGITQLAAFFSRYRRLFVLGGAGCSTASGIPDYRDDVGAWKRRPPVTWQAFRNDPPTRARYWARSLIGWPMMAAAAPNAAHHMLAQLEAAGHVDLLVTQNVDGLHQAGGSRRVIDLHGRIDRIVCTACGDVTPRQAFQLRLTALNPAWAVLSARSAPDGDADLESADFSGFVVPPCAACGGLLKPDVVFFGENVPPAQVADAMSGVASADAMLVVGSSLMVYSGFRFARMAADRGIPIAAINRGLTRADPLLALKIERGVGEALSEAWEYLK